MLPIVVVTGGRNFTNKTLVNDVLSKLRNEIGNFFLYQGGCSGADVLAKEWALINGLMTKTFWADWATHGKAAGPVRNERMLLAAKNSGNKVVVVAFTGGRGTASCVRLAKKFNLTVVQAL